MCMYLIKQLLALAFIHHIANRVFLGLTRMLRSQTIDGSVHRKPEFKYRAFSCMHIIVFRMKHKDHFRCRTCTSGMPSLTTSEYSRVERSNHRICGGLWHIVWIAYGRRRPSTVQNNILLYRMNILVCRDSFDKKIVRPCNLLCGSDGPRIVPAPICPRGNIRDVRSRWHHRPPPLPTFVLTLYKGLHPRNRTILSYKIHKRQQESSWISDLN